MRRLATAALVLAALGQAAAAAPRTSPVPVSRPEVALAVPAPAPRPDDLVAAVPSQPALSPAPPAPADAVAAGPVCGAPDILGVRLEKVPGRLPACGVARPVRIASVAGLRLSQPAVVDCVTARALRTWVEQGVKPAIARLGGGPEGLRVAAHYICRTRNNRPGAKVSKHGLGRAIDISGIRLANGQLLSVEHGWRDEAHAPRLRRMHRAACGPFSTVLGPNADRFHRDHFHFDTARGRSRAYCR